MTDGECAVDLRKLGDRERICECVLKGPLMILRLLLSRLVASTCAPIRSFVLHGAIGCNFILVV